MALRTARPRERTASGAAAAVTWLSVLSFTVIVSAGCGSVHINSITSSNSSPVVITVSPATATVTASEEQQMVASVQGTSDPNVVWSVNDIVGGSASVGMITSSGLYSAPPIPPPSGAVTVRAVSAADPNSGFSATLNIADLVQVAPSSISTATGTEIQFLARIDQEPSSAVAWEVNGVPGGNAVLGTISANGLYTAPFVAPSSPLTVSATKVDSRSASGTAEVSVFDPAVRDLHSTWLAGVAQVAANYGCKDVKVQQQESELEADAISRFSAEASQGSCLVLWPISTDTTQLRYSFSWGGTIGGKDIMYLSDVGQPRIWNATPVDASGGSSLP